MIDLNAVELQIWNACRMLVGHRDGITSGHHGAGQRDRAQDPGNRDVTIQRSRLVKSWESLIQLPPNPDERQVCRRDASIDWFGIAQLKQE